MNQEMRMALAAPESYRAMQEFEATAEKVRVTVEETDTSELAAELRALAEDTPD